MKMATFTALNGGSPKATDGVNGSVDMTRTASEEQRPKASGQNPDAKAPAAAAAAATVEAPPSAAPAPPVSSATTTTTTPSASTAPTAQRERESWASPSLERPPYQPASYPDIENPHKRKRSDSIELRREHHHAEHHHAEHHHAEHHHAERSDEAGAGHQRPQSESRDPYGTPQRDYRSYGDEGRDHSDPWYAQQSRDDRGYDGPHSAAPGSAHTDDQIGETLRRATGQMDSGDYPQTSPDGDDRSILYGGHYSPEQRRDGVMHSSDPKKRKRNFSNRTKTGCLTCRKRKKKCDEAKPECSNCVRGGFVCAGYPQQRGAWPKPENKPTTIQIESKDPTYVPPGAYGMPQQNPYGNQGPVPPQQQKREPLPSYRGQPLRIEPPQGRPLQTDDERPTATTLPSASVASPDNKMSALSAYTTTANVFPTPVSAAPVPFPDRTPKEYQRVPPLHDLSRNEGDLPQHGNTLPQINILHATRTNSPISQAAAAAASGVQATAQLALSHTQFPSNRPRREKDEMLAGRQFYPFDKELVLERERCNAACWRFNSSTNPNNGVSPAERARLFREILQPREGVHISPSMTSPVTHTGQVGNEVVVEAPFTADYGYNIHIGKNVLIGRNCTIIDASTVHIGDNSIIGPNVCIYTTTLHTDPKRRQGARGSQLAQGVIIEEDVFIGANVVILPGVRIGKGTTVGAGSLVTKNLPKFCVCYGSPADVRRGVVSV